MTKGYGIDFGTTNSIISRYDTDLVCSIGWTDFTDDFGRPYPSVVWYKTDNSVKAGKEAKTNINKYSDQIGNKFISSVKSKLGQNYSYHIFGKDKKAVDVATDIFKLLKRKKEEKEEEEKQRQENIIIQPKNKLNATEKLEAVVTIPIDFDGKARRELRQAAYNAGVYIKSFIQEPYAAIVAHCWEKAGDKYIERLIDKNYLVMDWGGGTLDITIAKITENGFQVLAFEGQNNIGGDVFDEKLMKVVEHKFVKQIAEKHHSTITQSELNSDKKDALKQDCENCKIDLSELLEREVSIPNFFRLGDKSLPLIEQITRSEFEELILHEVNAGIEKVFEALDKARLTKDEIDSVLLIGGSCNIPLIKEKMIDIFGSSVETVSKPDCIIARGAALIDAIGLSPILQNDISIKLENNSYYPIFKAKSPIEKLQKETRVRLYCVDPRDGWAKIVVTDMKQPIKQVLGTLSVPVATNWNIRECGPQRLELKAHIDQDMVIHFKGHADNNKNIESIEIYDIPFGLSLNIDKK